MPQWEWKHEHFTISQPSFFTALFNWYFSHMSLRFISLFQVSQNPPIFAQAAEELQPINSLLSVCYWNKNINEAPIYHSCLTSSVSHPSLSRSPSLETFSPPSSSLIYCGVDQLQAVSNGLRKPISRPSPMQEMENSHQLVAMCSHIGITKGLCRDRVTKPGGQSCFDSDRDSV